MKHLCRSLVTGLGVLVLTFTGAPVLAQYKIVGPDGRVTYTDRLSPENAAVAQPMRIHSANQLLDQSATWPQELREAVRRYPVTLYTQRNCVPCDSARTLLTTRGIPFTEKTVTSRADISAFAELSGGETVLPGVTIGPQFVKGLNAGEWQGYLDAAGYPKTSRLPSSYRQPAAVPVSPPVSSVAGQTEPDSPATTGAPNRRVAPAPAAPATPQLRF